MRENIKTEKILRFGYKSTHTTLLDDFHRNSECIADGGKQLKSPSRHETDDALRTPAESKHEPNHAISFERNVIANSVK